MSGPADFHEPRGRALAWQARRNLGLLACEELTDRCTRVAEAVIALSFDADQSVARLPDQQRLCEMTDLDKTSVSKAVRLLREKRMLESWQEFGWTYYRFLPDAGGWAVVFRQPDPRVRQFILSTAASLFALNHAPAEHSPELPLPDEPAPTSALAHALAEVSRDDALATLVSSSEPSRVKSGRAPRDAGVPDNPQRLCRQPAENQPPPAAARETDAAAGAPTSAAANPADEVHRSPFADLKARLTSRVPYTERVGQPANSDPPPVAESPPPLAREPTGVGQPANSSVGQGANSWPASQLPHRARPPAPPADASEASGTSVPLQAQLASGCIPDAPDAREASEGDPDAGLRPGGGYSGDLREDLRLACGEQGWLQYLGNFWEPAIAADREGVAQVLADYRLRAIDSRRKPIGIPGGWMRRRFCATSKPWKETQR